MLGPKLAELTRGIERFTVRDGVHRTAIAPLLLSRASASCQPVQTVQEPAINRTEVGRAEVAHRRRSSTSYFAERMSHRLTCQPLWRERSDSEQPGSRGS